MTVAPSLDVGAFESYRPLLFGVAYRMLGSASSADDMVQDAYLRAATAGADEVRSLRSYLVTVVTRLCLDELKSARRRRETYTGPWLPEPIPTDHEPLIEDSIAERESISMAFMVLLERLGPVERAVFLLREVFDYGYGEIADVVCRSEAACRQAFKRAKGRIEAGKRRFPASRTEQAAMTVRFIEAASDGDLAGLIALQTDDIVAWSDGGGRVPSAINPIFGPSRVARFVRGLVAKSVARGLLASFEMREVNGELGIVWRDRRGRVSSVTVLEVAGGRIAAIRAVRNPQKLQRFGPPAGR